MLISAANEAAALGIAGGIGAFFICFYVLIIAAFITLFVFWLIAIVDIAQRKNSEFPNVSENDTPKNTWLLLLLVTLIVPVAAGVVAIIYYSTIMKKIPRGKVDSAPPQITKDE